jgi:hypothetical protein
LGKRTYLAASTLALTTIIVAVGLLLKPPTEAPEGRERASSKEPDAAKESPTTTEAEKRIKAFLGSKGPLSITRKQLTYRLPTLQKEYPTVLETTATIELSSGVNLEMVFIFSATGSFIRAESVKTMEDPYRKTLEEIERNMNEGFKERIVDIPSAPDGFSLKPTLESIMQRYKMHQAKEFNLSLVRYRMDRYGTDEILLILNIWGVDPIFPRRPAPDVLWQRDRAFFTPKGEFIKNDNLL